MVKLRLRRTGAKKKPSYRLVAADSRAPRDGAFLETVGHYNPLTEPATIKINEALALKWLRHGAQPTEAAQRLLVSAGIWEKFKQVVVATAEPAPKIKAAPKTKATATKKAEPASPAAVPATPEATATAEAEAVAAEAPAAEATAPKRRSRRAKTES